VSPAKTTELIEMLFGFCTPVGPTNHVLDVGEALHPPGEGAVLEVVPPSENALLQQEH